MAKNRKKASPETGGAAKFTMIWLVNIYVFLMLAVYPLYYHDKYYDMSDAKWGFFKYVSLVFAILAGLIFIWYVGSFIADGKIKEFLKTAYENLTLTDGFALAYLAVCCISTFISPYRQYAIWGYEGWYMGLAAQVCFVLIYFLVSRYWRWDSTHLFIFLMTAFVVFFFGVIMRFRIDPMEMYGGLDEYNIQHFISTLGQTTWYSSYMCIICPLGLMAYMCAKKSWQRVAFGIFCVMSFMTVVTQNSDSAYVAIAGIFYMLFWISFESDEQFLRFMECVIMALGSFKLMGLFQMIWADRMVSLDRLSIFMSQSGVTAVLFVLVTALYLLMKLVVYKKTGFHITSLKKVRTGLFMLAALGTIFMVAYICLNTTGKLPDKYLSENNYLVFDDSWGNNRGVSWRCALGAYLKGDILRKFFGVGPDCFARIIYTYYRADMEQVFGKETAQICAHNEWLNSLVNLGLLGLVSYLGIFVSAFTSCIRGAKKYPYLYGTAIAIGAYFLHNFFCYQQIICTPTIFILMGMAQSVIRYGYAKEETAPAGT